MRTLLIVEDEKAIRMGLRSIVERAPIEIETVLDCKNGAEAWELLQSRPVDVLFTDIRMPKMDGVALVEKSKSLPSPPISIVISGYDDFSYAVGAFRQGVRDYLLKPIERERVFEILKSIDAELEDNRRQLESSREIRGHLYRSFIWGGGDAPAAGSVFSRQLDGLLFHPYAVVCVSPALCIPAESDEVCVLKDMDGHQALIAKASALPNLRQSMLNGCCAGISREADNPARLRVAYLEAVAAREYAFVRGNTETFANLPAWNSALPIGDKLVQIVQLLGASRIEEACSTLEQVLFLAQNGRISPADFIKGAGSLPDSLIEAYGFLLEEKDGLRSYKNLWMWNSAFEYCRSLQGCISGLFAARMAESRDDARARIHKAVMYVKNNFRSDINMAMVSNEVSMNYTQFSHLFKEYTGCNFLVFLRNMRLEEGKTLLATTQLTIANIARESGFQNEKHFMKSFKRSTGVSPSVYRKNIRPKE